MATLASEQENQSAVAKGSSVGDQRGISAAQDRWTLPTRIAFRFSFAYTLLLSLAGQIGGVLIYAISITKLDLPGLGQLWPMRQITFWTALHIFRVNAPLLDTGSGDTVFDWTQTFCFICFASVATALWTVADRKRGDYSILWKWFRVFLRLALATQMFVYGFSKMIPNQMPFPPLDKLIEQYGNFSPMAVLWNSVGASPVYEAFTGTAEVVGGLLLLLPATITLGSLICVADLAMVFILNMSYDVCVKIGSFHLLGIALLLLIPDLRRLLEFFFTDRAIGPRVAQALFRSMRADRIAVGVQLLLGIYLAGFWLRSSIHDWHTYGDGRPKPPLYGIWNVEQMEIDGQEHPPLLTDSDRWRRVLFGTYENDDVQVQRMDDTLLYLTSSVSRSGMDVKDKGPLTLWGYPGHPELAGHFTLAHPNAEELTLDGSLQGHRIHAVLKRFDLQRFTLLNRGFHWVNDYAFQR